MLIRLIKADFYKMIRTKFYLIHILVPVLSALAFIMYYIFNMKYAMQKIMWYSELEAMVCPIVIASVTSFIIESEYDASKFKEMLSLECGRSMCLLSKIIVLLIMFIFSLLLAFLVLAGGLKFIFRGEVDLKICITAVIIIFLTDIFMYVFHLFLSLKFGSGISISVGIIETVLAALLDTGLGDGIWMFVPCAWPIRIVSYYLALAFRIFRLI